MLERRCRTIDRQRDAPRLDFGPHVTQAIATAANLADSSGIVARMALLRRSAVISIPLRRRAPPAADWRLCVFRMVDHARCSMRRLRCQGDDRGREVSEVWPSV